VAAAGQDDTVAAVKAVRQAFETISLPAVIDLVPGGIDKGVYVFVHFASFMSVQQTDCGWPGTTSWSRA
jgi:hypothetical protein